MESDDGVENTLENKKLFILCVLHEELFCLRDVVVEVDDINHKVPVVSLILCHVHGWSGEIRVFMRKTMNRFELKTKARICTGSDLKTSRSGSVPVSYVISLFGSTVTAHAGKFWARGALKRRCQNSHVIRIPVLCNQPLCLEVNLPYMSCSNHWAQMGCGSRNPSNLYL